MKTQPYITFTKVILLSQLKNEQKNRPRNIGVSSSYVRRQRVNKQGEGAVLGLIKGELMITNSNQICFAKIATRGLQEVILFPQNPADPKVQFDASTYKCLVCHNF